MKTLITALIALGLQIGLQAQDLSANLKIELPFSGNANNNVSNDFNGVINGATLTYDRFDIPDKAFHFDGINDYIEIPYNDNLNHPDSFTVSIWAQSEGGFTETHVIFDFGFARDYGIGIHYTSNEKKVGAFAFNETLLDNVPNLDKEWHQYILTFNGDELQYFIDGILREKRTIDVTSIDHNPLRIGAQSKNLARYWHGKIDDFRYYARGFSADEALDLFRIESENPTSIANINNYNSNSFYPNPAKESINFLTPLNYEIYNTNGEAVAFGFAQEINLQNLSPGIYIIKTNNNQMSCAQKLIITK
ncbi:MAG: LamG-like jellyroll fold domain-containing protein [Flavobacteriales bacterium]